MKMTISDSEEEEEVQQKKKKKRSKKEKAKKEENQNFTLIDDSIKKDLSKIQHRREYDATNESGKQWKFGNAVKDDVQSNISQNSLEKLRNRILELKKELNFEEIDKGIEELTRNLKKDNISELNTMEKPKKGGNLGAHAKVHYEKDDLISFHDLFLSRPLVKACNSLEYDHPTRIQSQVIPNILENRDLLVNAVTGSGKTASYVLPILEKLHRRDLRTSKVSNTKIGKTRVLILQPTRELAAQCSSMLDNMNKFIIPKISYTTIIGGSSMKKQEAELMDKPDIVVATPGRLLDILMNSKSIYFNNIEALILDEADKLLEMGFQEMIEEILKNIKKDSDVENVQTCLFSATLTKDIKRLASLALRDPKLISEAKQQNSVNAYLKLSHYIVKVPEIERVKKEDNKKKKKRKNSFSDDSDSDEDDDSDSDKDSNKEESEEKKEAPKQSVIVNTKARVQRIRESIILSLVMKTYTKKTIIFVNTKTQCHRMYVLFTFFGLKVAEVHGNLSQKQRMESVEKFQAGEMDFLVSTDLLARGLDIYNVQCVINFSFPNEENRYVHRVGRTARAGNSGVAITLCDENDRKQTMKVVRKCKGNAKNYSYTKQLKDSIFTLINLLDEPIHRLIQEERSDFQLEKAEVDLKKAQNILSYQDEIYNRPKKEWFQSKKQQKEALKQGKQEMKDREFNPHAKKKKQIERIKKRKRELREQEKRGIMFEKPPKPKVKKVKSKKVHGKSSMFNSEI
ncbi:unnamed protein product [Moneuplotes crassus]|uniref:DEAD/DEAH box helicase n=1 Tax=Euplotes crassus TaxID=5936 RepID=A0AAD2D9Z1_EUPCR|nr:unnamed protein product [Moneuplotes crassus]